mgnify:CR=1 FL=1
MPHNVRGRRAATNKKTRKKKPMTKPKPKKSKY